MSLITRRRLLGVPLALGAASLAACGGGSDDDNTGDANVRLLNLMSDVASLDLWADSSTRWFNDAATDALTEYKEVDSDTFDLELHSAGASSILLSSEQGFGEDLYYTLVAWGRAGAPKSAQAPTACASPATAILRTCAWTSRTSRSRPLTQSHALVAGAVYTLVALGTTASPTLAWLSNDNRLPSTSTRTKVRLVHGDATLDALTLSIDYGVTASDVAVGAASSHSNLTSNDSARVDVTTASLSTGVYSATEVNLQAQGVYTLFVLGGNSAPTGVLRKDR